MTTIRRRSVEIPTDESGMLERQCPRCRDRFSVDIEHHQERGYMNLRCPYCRFISELDNFITGDQRAYLYSTTQNVAREAAEQIFDEAFGDLSGSSSGSVDFEIDTGDINLSRAPVESPSSGTDLETTSCDDCGFSYGLAETSQGVCPVCR